MESVGGSYLLETALFKMSEYLDDSDDNVFVKMLHQVSNYPLSSQLD